MSYIRPTNPSPQLETVFSWFDALISWDFDTLASKMADDYIHTSLPASTGEPNKTKEEGLQHAKSVAGMFAGKDINFEIYDVNESQGKIWVHCKLAAETVMGPLYNNESVFLFTLKKNRNAPQISAIKEFVDSKSQYEFAKKLRGDEGCD